MECGSFSLSLGRKEREKSLFLSGVSASVRSLLRFPLPLEKSLRILSVIGLSITNTYIMHNNAISYIIMQYHREIIRLNHPLNKDEDGVTTICRPLNLPAPKLPFPLQLPSEAKQECRTCCLHRVSRNGRQCSQLRSECERG